MLEDGSEHPCVCVDVSVGGVRLQAAQAGPWGSRVVAYIEGIGRIEGYIVRRAIGEFIEAEVRAEHAVAEVEARPEIRQARQRVAVVALPALRHVAHVQRQKINAQRT